MYQHKDLKEESEFQQSQKKSNQSLQYPCFFSNCGHIFDFVGILDSYREGQKWICPNCRGSETSLKGIKVFKNSDLSQLQRKTVHNESASKTKQQSKARDSNEMTVDKSQYNVDMLLQDIEQRISQLSLMDISSVDDSQRGNILNFKIENLLGEVSLNSTQISKGLTFSPVSLKAQETRSATTLSTNSSSIRNDGGQSQLYQRFLRFNNQSAAGLPPSTCSSQNGSSSNSVQIPIGAASKSEMKRNWKLQNVGAIGSDSTLNQSQEFKMPSPRIKNQQQLTSSSSERSRINNKRNRSAFRETENDKNKSNHNQIDQQEVFRQQTTLKKRPLSSNKKQEQVESLQKVNKDRTTLKSGEDQSQIGFHLNTYKRQRFQ